MSERKAQRSDVLSDVLADLAARNADLDALLVGLDEDGWSTPTPAPGWTVKHQLAHLTWTDGAAAAAATDEAAWDAIVADALEDPGGFVDRTADEGAAYPGVVVRALWLDSAGALADVLRGYPGGTPIPWFGPPMSAASMATARYMETWAHSLDVADALGAELPATDAVRHVAHLGVRARDFAYAVHQLAPPAQDLRVELVGPSGATWAWGPAEAEQRVTGSAYDFALLVTQRRHRDDLAVEATGSDADRWLDIAQAFAGPPGDGRAPTAPAGGQHP